MKSAKSLLLQHNEPAVNASPKTHRQHRRTAAFSISYTTTEAAYVLRNNEILSCNHCCSGEAMSTTSSEYVFVALGIRHATRMRRIILSSVARPALPYFSTLSHKDFRGKSYGT